MCEYKRGVAGPNNMAGTFKSPSSPKIHTCLPIIVWCHLELLLEVELPSYKHLPWSVAQTGLSRS